MHDMSIPLCCLEIKICLKKMYNYSLGKFVSCCFPVRKDKFWKIPLFIIKGNFQEKKGSDSVTPLNILFHQILCCCQGRKKSRFESVCCFNKKSTFL